MHLILQIAAGIVLGGVILAGVTAVIVFLRALMEKKNIDGDQDLQSPNQEADS